MHYQHFDFVVENMSDQQAHELLDRILEFVEERGLQLGGGFHQTTDDDYPEVDNEQEDPEGLPQS